MLLADAGTPVAAAAVAAGALRPGGSLVVRAGAGRGVLAALFDSVEVASRRCTATPLAC